MSLGPLHGIRVLDFGQGVAGPYCGQLLADHGADVIKIEPPRGDWSRTMGIGKAGGQSAVFVSVNRGKEGISLDLRRPEAVEVVRRLARDSHVVVESFRPGVMDRLGLGRDCLRESAPSLIYCSVTGFGSDGPNVDLPAGDSTMQAYGGLMSIIGERDGDPLRVGNVVSDMLAGMNAFSGVLLALLERRDGLRGRDIEVALLDSIVAFQAPPLTEYLMTQRLPQRMGNDHPLISPSGSMHTSDGVVTLTVFDHQWKSFCVALGQGDLAEDARFATSAGRQQHRDALAERLRPIFAADTSNAWLARLRAMDVLCAPVNDYAELVADPQVLHNRLIAHIDDGDVRYPVVRNPVRGLDAPVMRAPPGLGEHTRRVLRKRCSLEPEQVEVLIANSAAFAPHEENVHG